MRSKNKNVGLKQKIQQTRKEFDEDTSEDLNNRDEDDPFLESVGDLVSKEKQVSN